MDNETEKKFRAALRNRIEALGLSENAYAKNIGVAHSYLNALKNEKEEFANVKCSSLCKIFPEILDVIERLAKDRTAGANASGDSAVAISGNQNTVIGGGASIDGYKGRLILALSYILSGMKFRQVVKTIQDTK